jgi:hypothetical protein
MGSYFPDIHPSKNAKISVAILRILAYLMFLVVQTPNCQDL